MKFTRLVSRIFSHQEAETTMFFQLTAIWQQQQQQQQQQFPSIFHVIVLWNLSSMFHREMSKTGSGDGNILDPYVKQ